MTNKLNEIIAYLEVDERRLPMDNQIQSLSAEEQMQLALLMIKRGHGSYVSAHLDRYQLIDQRALALYMATHCQACVVLQHFHKFDQLTSDDQVDIATAVLNTPFAVKALASSILVLDMYGFHPDAHQQIMPMLLEEMRKGHLDQFYTANYISHINGLTLEFVTNMVKIADDFGNFMAQYLLRGMKDDRVKKDELDQIKEFLNKKLDGLPV
jgi:hypothetical protein